QTGDQQGAGEEARRILWHLSGCIYLNSYNPMLSDTPAIRRNVSLLPKYSMRAMISLLYPQSVLEPRMPDELFREETEAMAAAGHSVHLIDTEALNSGPSRIRPPFEPGARVVYRGALAINMGYASG